MSKRSDLLPTKKAATALKGERRAWVRYQSRRLRSSWRLYGSAAGDSWMVGVRDISVAGIGLVFNIKIRRGTVLVVNLEARDKTFGRPLLVRVCNVSPQPDGTWLVGCSFVRNLSDAELLALI